MLTAIISDLHLGATSGCDVVRRPDVQARLMEAIAPADRVVVLGDLLETREQPARTVLEVAAPFLDALGEVTAGKQVVIVPGNHDHELVRPALDRASLAGDGTLSSESTFSPDEGALICEVAGHLPRAELVLAYPGIRLRHDVYALHGHYLDLHLTVPRMECVIASAVARLVGGREGGSSAPPEKGGISTPPAEGELSTPATYEAALAPVYAFAYSVAQASEARAVTRGGQLTRMIWSRTNPGGRRSLAGMAIGGLAIPGGVWALNRMGLGPFRADISSLELRRAGLRAMGTVVRSLGIEADHVIFGHTHRAGPLPSDDQDDDGWILPGGTRLTNTGSWLYESVFVGGGEGRSNPYWPGSVTLLGDDGPPRLTNVLEKTDL